MTRFGKLEFEPDRHSPEKVPDRENTAFDSSHWLQQADSHRRCGHYENALRMYSRALEEDKSIVEGWVGQVQMLVLLDECPEAEVWSGKGLELFPSHGDLLAARAQALCRLQKIKLANVACDGSMTQSGQSAYRWMVRGELLVANRQPMEMHCFDKATQVDGDWLVPLETALIYLYYHTPSKANGRARQAVENAADQYYAWYILGLCQFELGMTTPARTSFGRCLKLQPGHVEAGRRLQETGSVGASLFRRFRRMLGRS